MHFASALVLVLGAGLLALPAQKTVRSTAVIHFSVPANAASGVLKGSCESSRAAWFRSDAARCTSADGTVNDPCFRNGANHWFCVKDPRKTDSFQPLEAGPAVASNAAQGAVHRAWFFELPDGTTCTPLAAPGREIERLTELYSCRWGTDGDADAVLGELDASQPVWTIRKVLINKKVDPQTIKSFTVVPVATVWE
jgi:hypothetical protein